MTREELIAELNGRQKIYSMDNPNGLTSAQQAQAITPMTNGSLAGALQAAYSPSTLDSAELSDWQRNHLSSGGDISSAGLSDWQQEQLRAKPQMNVDMGQAQNLSLARQPQFTPVDKELPGHAPQTAMPYGYDQMVQGMTPEQLAQMQQAIAQYQGTLK
jgi:hypothetical protein